MRPTFTIAAAIGFAALLTITGQAQAQLNRTFVSGHGSDNNPCSLPAPCRSFAQALSQTNAGGEITVLDPAGYGSVAITKSVSIVNDGVGEAGVTVSTMGTNAITVTIGASDVVNLRGLTVTGGGVGGDGVLFVNGPGALNIQNCVIRGFSNTGLDFEPSGNGVLNVSDTIVSNSGGGFTVFPHPFGNATAVFNRAHAIGNKDGFFIQGGGTTSPVDVTIANSVASNNGDAGIRTLSDTGLAQTGVVVSNSVISNNATGILENGAGSVTYLAKNTITGNTTAFTVSNSGFLFSFGDNYIRSNSSDGGVIALVATK